MVLVDVWALTIHKSLYNGLSAWVWTNWCHERGSSFGVFLNLKPRCVSVSLSGCFCSLKVVNYSLKVNWVAHINAFTPLQWLRDRWAWKEMERWEGEGGEGRNLPAALSPQFFFFPERPCVESMCDRTATSTSTLISAVRQNVTATPAHTVLPDELKPRNLFSSKWRALQHSSTSMRPMVSCSSRTFSSLIEHFRLSPPLFSI